MDVVVKVARASLIEVRTPLLVVNLFEGQEQPVGATAAVDEVLGGLLGRLINDGEITGALGEVTIVHNQGDRAALAADRIAVVGLGKRDALDLEALRVAAATVARRARDLRVGRYATVVHGAGTGGQDPRLAARTLVEASLLGLYSYEQFKSAPDELPRVQIEEITLVERDSERAEAFDDAAREATTIAAAVAVARDLSQGPSNLVTPSHLADRAREMAEARGIACEVWGKDQLREKGMNAILAVNSGSAQEPRFVTLRYTSPGATRTLAVVGKGITFDSGGISIKPGAGMENMKHDMSGAAAVVGFLQLAADLKLPVNVLGVFAATDNVPSGTSYKPGDVFRAYNGKTIEVNNTDAEGRVLLSDALAWTAEQEPDAIVDLATLTGACVVALGHHATGAVGNDEGLLSLMRQAGDLSGERVWPLPLWPPYRKDIESSIADIKNSAGREAGAVTGGAFLENFVAGRPWVHLDIAGTAYTEGQSRVPPYQPSDAATGVGVRLLNEFARRWNAA